MFPGYGLGKTYVKRVVGLAGDLELIEPSSAAAGW